VLSGSPRRVTVDGHGELPQLQDRDAGEPGWWHDGVHFTHIRLPRPPATITIEL
jgi:hypothetical protein